MDFLLASGESVAPSGLRCRLANPNHPDFRPLLFRFPVEQPGTLGHQLIIERFGFVIVDQTQGLPWRERIKTRKDGRVALPRDQLTYIEINNGGFCHVVQSSLSMNRMIGAKTNDTTPLCLWC